MVSGADEHSGIRVFCRNLQCRRQNRGGRVSSFGFDENGGGINTYLGQLFRNDKPKIRPGHDNRCTDVELALSKSQGRGLKESCLAQNRGKLLWKRLAA